MKNNYLSYYCEYNEKSSKSYSLIHNVPESLNLGDITKVDEKNLPPFNVICGGSPCQDFSLAGKKLGSLWTCKDCKEEYNPLTVHFTKRKQCPKCHSENIDKSRSSLLVEWLRVIEYNKPNWGVYENVKNIVGKQFKETFNMFIKELEEYGYNVYWKVLNAKDYGIPQNRERLFMIIIKKEIDNGLFEFPIPFDNGLRLKDIVDKVVDVKYYLKENQIEKIYNWKSFQRPFTRIYGKNSICPTITARGAGEYHSGMVLYSDKLEDTTNCEKIFDNKDDIINYVKYLKPRVLTEKESFRVIGFSDSDYDKVKDVIKKRELYRQTGNSIVVDVLYHIFVELHSVMPYLFDDIQLGSYFSGIGAFEKALDKLFS